MHKPSKLMSIVECYQACHAFVTRASEIVDILNAMNHRASKCQMMAAPTLHTCENQKVKIKSIRYVKRSRT